MKTTKQEILDEAKKRIKNKKEAQEVADEIYKKLQRIEQEAKGNANENKNKS